MPPSTVQASATAAHTDAAIDAPSSQPRSPRSLHVVIPHTTAPIRSAIHPQWTFGHGHPGAHTPDHETPTAATPRNQHPSAALFALASPSTPTRPRPSVRASRGSTFFAGTPGGAESPFVGSPEVMHALVNAVHSDAASQFTDEPEEDPLAGGLMGTESIQPMEMRGPSHEHEELSQ